MIPGYIQLRYHAVFSLKDAAGRGKFCIEKRNWLVLSGRLAVQRTLRPSLDEAVLRGPAVATMPHVSGLAPLGRLAGLFYAGWPLQSPPTFTYIYRTYCTLWLMVLSPLLSRTLALTLKVTLCGKKRRLCLAN